MRVSCQMDHVIAMNDVNNIYPEDSHIYIHFSSVEILSSLFIMQSSEQGLDRRWSD